MHRNSLSCAWLLHTVHRIYMEGPETKVSQALPDHALARQEVQQEGSTPRQSGPSRMVLKHRYPVTPDTDQVSYHMQGQLPKGGGF